MHATTRTWRWLCCVLLAAAIALPCTAQTLSLTNLPADDSNSRFYSDEFPLIHPSLSLNGFDCSRRDCDYGLGLRQVLEETYDSATPQVTRVLDKLLSEANKSMPTPSSVGEVRGNTVRLQAKAFVALAAYIVEQNGTDPQSLTPALPDPDTARDDLKAALLNSNLWAVDEQKTGGDDALKWATPVTNVARAIDLYLALENAYRHFEPAEYNNTQSTKLLTASQKADVLYAYGISLWRLDHLGAEGSGFMQEMLSEVSGVTAYDLQAGNWPLKVQVALGYGLLTQQNVDMGSFYDIDEDHLVRRAFKAAGKQAGTNRYHYWRYQVDDGKRFWAVGPYYFHLTVSQIIPLWHTARINGLLSNSGVLGYTLSGDPFDASWLTEPLEWLADLATPGGKTPPLDDGNKKHMYNSSVLRWTSAYGDYMVGRKFTWINSREAVGGVGSSPDLQPVEIAIPRRPDSEGVPPAGAPNQYGDQQLVRRSTLGGHTHYLLLNGEHGDAITRGEGHEQGDQLQLLYYVGETSYLLDSGYDSAYLLENSSWNRYYDHNVMIAEPNQGESADGGVRRPSFSFYKKRFESDHQDVNDLTLETASTNLDVLSGRVELYYAPDTYLPFADYWRRVLFVRDPQRPYLVDINTVSSDKDADFSMRYHANTNSRTALGDDAFWFRSMYESRENSISPPRASTSDGGGDLFVQAFPFRSTSTAYTTGDKARETYVSTNPGNGVSISRLDIDQQDVTSHTTVAFLRPLLGGASTPPKVQAGRRPWASEITWQYFAWPHSSTTVDVLVARSSEAYADPSSREALTVAIAEAGYFYVHLPQNEDFGFARLVKQGSTWAIDADYQVHLTAGTAPPLAASIQGPSCVMPQATNPATWIGEGYGGQPPYRYEWYRECGTAFAPDCQGGWQIVDQDDQYTTSPDGTSSYFRMKLRVEDARYAAAETIRRVEVGGCEGGGYGPEGGTEGRTEGGAEGGAESGAEQPRAAQHASSLQAAEVLPETYALDGAYPNPFNPQTTLRFALPESARVHLVVYDVMGREVARLVDGHMAAGWHEAVWAAGAQPSGVYLVRLVAEGSAGAFVQTERLVLTK